MHRTIRTNDGPSFVRRYPSTISQRKAYRKRSWGIIATRSIKRVSSLKKKKKKKKKERIKSTIAKREKLSRKFMESFILRDKSAQLDCLIMTGKKMYLSLFVGRPASPGNTIRSLDRRFYYCIVISWQWLQFRDEGDRRHTVEKLL